MSIWSDLGGALTKGLTKGISGAVATKINPQPKIVAPIIAAAGRVLPAVGRVLGSPAVTAGSIGLGVGALLGSGGGGVCASGFHLAKDGSGRCVRNRRMNFGNARAARRSVRRLKGARKLLRDIERMMPTKTRTKTVKVPVHHDHHGHH